MTAGNVNLIDSLSFFLQPLCALPKAFGLNANIAKGYFPHYFNIEDNNDYVGPMPSLEYYGVEYMKLDEAKKVREWCNEQVQNNYFFNFKNELIKYCENDVDICIKSVMVFRKNVIDITGIDPYTTSFTLAALGLKVFRTRFLPDNQTIGITPIKGHGKRGNYIKASQCWLDRMQYETDNIIKREYMLENYVAYGVDYKKIVYEFFGCKFHGCECIYKDNRDDVLIEFDKTPNKLYYETQCKLDYYKTIGYECHYIWECEF